MSDLDLVIGALAETAADLHCNGTEESGRLADALDSVARYLSQKVDQGGTTRRLGALKAAREHVAAMYAEKDARGYPKHNATSEQKLRQELEVAAFLLNQDGAR